MLKSLICNPRRQQFLYLLIFYAAFLWFRIFGFSVLAPLFLEKNITLQQMMMGNAVFFAVQFIWLLLFRRQFSRFSWFLATIVSIVGLLFASQVTNVWHYYFYSLLLGMGAVLYFVPYNIAHFRLTPGHRNSLSAAIMFSIVPFISFIAPLAAGIVAQISYNYIWFGSVIFFLVVVAMIGFQVDFEYRFNLKKDLVYLKPTWLIVILQGLWEPINFAIIPLFALNFVTAPLAFGSFMSYLGLVAIAANLFFGRLSDRLKERVRFLIPTTILLGLATMALPFALNSFTAWLVLGGVINFLSPLFWNFSTAYFVDRQPDSERSMAAREWLLAGSRVVGLILIFMNYYWQVRPTYFFYLLGAVMLIYPLILGYNTRHEAKF